MTCDLDAARRALADLAAEAKRLGIPHSYIRTIEATQAAVDMIEKARNK